MKTWISWPSFHKDLSNFESLYSTRRSFCCVGTDNAIHFTLVTFQIFLSLMKIPFFQKTLLYSLNKTHNVSRSVEKSIWNIGRIICVMCTCKKKKDSGSPIKRLVTVLKILFMHNFHDPKSELERNRNVRKLNQIFHIH